MFGLGTPEIVLIAIVILVLFGAKKIPELMQGLGKGIKEFKKASSDIEKDLTSTDDSDKKNSN
ncbi:MAG: twin-arginine translocase TatA/TatE family subunit [Bacteroidetes bacterium]|nr:twin-arginine translocase TatA/TatE family subunit [Bacteroidota bacterium]